MNLFGKPFYIDRKTMFYMALVLFVMFALFHSGHAFAAPTDSDNGLPYEKALTKLVASMTGPVALMLSVVGIVIAGG